MRCNRRSTAFPAASAASCASAPKRTFRRARADPGAYFRDHNLRLTVAVASPTLAVQVFGIAICGRMKPHISSIEVENRVVVAKYQRLMVGAKVVLVEKASGRQLPETIT